MKCPLTLVPLIALAVAGCSSGGGDPAASAQPETVNRQAVFSAGKEARAWIGSGQNHMFEASDQNCKEAIETLYRLGAVEVRVVDGEKLDENSKGETASTLMAKLPDDKAKRSALFDYESQITEDPDQSQNRDYVEIVFD